EGEKMRLFKIKILIVGEILITLAFADWTCTYVGESHYPGSSTLCIFVGDGDNDGYKEVYTGTWTPSPYYGYTHQFKWNGNIWIMDTLSTRHQYNIMDVTVGDANNDGENEVYSSAFAFLQGETKDLYQFIFQDSIWILRDSLGREGGFQTFIADGDNDGLKEIYAIGHVYYTRVHQYKWNGSSWDLTMLGDNGYNFHSLYVGDGDNDNLNEIYATNVDGNIHYYKWEGDTWGEYLIPLNIPEEYCITFKGGLVIGDPDNDGLNEVYCSFYRVSTPHYRLIYRYIWNGSNWIKDSIILIPDPDCINGGLVIGDGDNDGQDEIYDMNSPGTPGNIGIYKIFWNGINWQYEFIPATIAPGGPGIDLVLGDGDNDGLNELYLATGTGRGKIYQFKYLQRIKEIRDFSYNEIKIYPVFTRGKVKFYISSPGKDRNLKIYDKLGRLVKILPVSGFTDFIIWDGKNVNNKIMNPDIYFVKLGSKTQKFLFLK
ncbi:MAG: hypothetical protein ABIN23_08115, partial [candidate division WOR-3 bacterium]